MDWKSLGSLLQNLGEVVVHIVHVQEALITKIFSSIPEKPLQAIPFIAVLLPVVLYMGSRFDEKKQNLCFACMAGLVVIALALVFVAVKHPSDNQRLSAMQDQRMSAVRVRPIHYESLSNPHDDENPRD